MASCSCTGACHLTGKCGVWPEDKKDTTMADIIGVQSMTAPMGETFTLRVRYSDDEETLAFDEAMKAIDEC